MRILLFVPKGYPRLGGSEVLAGNLARAYAARGSRPTILAPRQGKEAARETVGGIPVRRYGSRKEPARRRFWTGVVLPFAAAALREVPRHDVVQAMGCNTSAYLAWRVARARGRPFVVSLQTGGPEGDLETFARSKGGRQRLERMIGGGAWFCAISDQTESELVRFGVPEARRVRIPNGIDAEAFSPPSEGERARLRKELGFGAEPLVLAGGRMVPRKRLDRAVRIFALAAKRVPGATLCLSGDGPERPALERLVRDLGLAAQVRFSTAPAEVHRRHLLASDAYLHTAEAEGMPLAVLEAMSAGLCVVAPAIGGVSDVIDAGKDGLLYRPGDEEGAAELLARSLAGDTRSLCARAREKVLEGYSVAQVAERYLELFRGAGTAE